MRSNQGMTKAEQEGQLLDLIAVALLTHEYDSVANMPDQLDRALRKTMNESGLTVKFPDLNFSIKGVHFAFLLRRAPKKNRQYFTRWTQRPDEELPRCEYHFGTTAQDLFDSLAEDHGTTSGAWKDAANRFIELLEKEDYKVLVRPDETYKQVRERFPLRG